MSSTGEPESLAEALKSSRWKNAMQDEYDALQRNGTWTLVPSSRDKNIVECKWVYKVKRMADG
jgi:histone deacetylase 1/2